MPPFKPTRQSLPHYLTQARTDSGGSPGRSAHFHQTATACAFVVPAGEDLGRFFRISKPYRGGRTIARPPGHGGRQVSLHRQIARRFEQAFTHAKLDALLARIADPEPHLRLAV
jgi:hypothetical protein